MGAINGTGGRRRSQRFNPDRDVAEWHGAYRPYDLVKEFNQFYHGYSILGE